MVLTTRKFKAMFEQAIVTGEIELQQQKAPVLKKVLERFGVFNT